MPVSGATRQAVGPAPPPAADRVLERVEREAGTSIVEVIVATMLLAVGVVAVVGSLGSAGEAAATGEHRSTAAGISVNELESIRATPYEMVGIATADAGYVSRFEGRSTVTEADNRVASRGEVTAGGITFEIRRHVTWGAVQVGGSLIPEAYKHVTVVVIWADQTGGHTLRLDTGISEASSG
jgi:Tfp pilus assembly protein PilV